MFFLEKKCNVDGNSPLIPTREEKDQLKGFIVTKNNSKVRLQMHARKYLRKTKILFILETDKGITFYDRSLSLPLLFTVVWLEWGFQDLTYYQLWIICKPGKALPWTCNNQILGIVLKAKHSGERTAGFTVKTWNLLWFKILMVWPYKDDQVLIQSLSFHQHFSFSWNKFYSPCYPETDCSKDRKNHQNIKPVAGISFFCLPAFLCSHF